ncbi:sensor histidine kinase [Kaarinaea lacus]
MTSQQFRKHFLRLIFLAWTVPPVFGLSFLLYIKMFTGTQMLDILMSPLEPVFIISSLFFALWYFSKFCTKTCDYLDAPTTQKSHQLIADIKRFPLHFWGVFLVYLLIAPVTVIYSAEWFSNFIATPIDWFRINLVALIVSIIVGLPLFFLILDLFGKITSNAPLVKPFLTIKTKVFLIGALIPLLLDTMLVQYYWTRTGYFTAETFTVWLFLEFLAIAGSLIFVHSFGQSLAPLQRAINEPKESLEQNYVDMAPQSTDELGVLTIKYRELLKDLHKQHGKLEELVLERTEELATANQELEAFSYSVSHDLRGPLRSIDGYSQALLEDYPEKLDDTGKHYLNRLSASSKRMAQLIDDMLVLSRISRQELCKSTLDLSQLARESLAYLTDCSGERNTELCVEDNLKIYGDERLMKILLDNLLNNAFKYTSKNQKTIIEIGYDSEKRAFFIRDNGVGFDMRYVDKVFVPFQRLHREDEFEGNGIGLATVNRIINRHNGRIWVESEIDKGTTIHFTMPSRDVSTDLKVINNSRF